MDVSAYVNSIVNAKVSAGGTPFRDGDYVLAVDSLKIEKSVQSSEIWFKAEFLVITSKPVEVDATMHRTKGKYKDPDITVGADGIKRLLIAPNAAGSKASVVVDIGRNVGQSNAKAIMCALLGKNPSEVDPTWLGVELSKAIDASQPLKGTPCTMSTFRKLIKGGQNAGQPMVGSNWDGYTYAAGEDPAQVKAGLKAMIEKAAAAQ